MTNIPFNRPCLVGTEFEYIRQAIEAMHISGDGSFTKKCHAFLEKECGVANAFLTTSCTDALEMAALLLDVKPDDEVIVPSFTFVSTINAFTLRGAKPVFVDIRPDTLNIDERLIEATITPRTKVIVVVHYAGVGCEMDAIMAVSQRHGIPVVEDNAHGFLGRYKGRNLGTFGAFATLSFHETKNVICGEGGALLINEPRFVERAEIIRDKGTNRSKYFRGQVDKYSWVDVGSSFLPSDILAAFLFAQLEKRDEIQEKRKQIWQSYYGGLKDWAQENGVRLPVVPEYCEQSYHMFYLLMPSLEQRETLIRHLGEHGISSVFHYLPLHLSEMGRRFGGRPGDCPVTEQVSDRLLRLPFYNGMTQDVIQEVVDTVQKWAP